jgi:hypothetical protein
MGNEKQVLIYRSCATMDHYLEKYRLPKDFKGKLDAANKICEEIYDKKKLTNVAISIHAKAELLQELQK